MAKNPKAPAKGRSARKRVRRTLTEGKAFIHASYNNTIVTITDPDGNPVAWSSPGRSATRARARARPTPRSSLQPTRRARPRTWVLATLDIVIRGTGSGREQAIRSIQSTGVNVRSIIDDTPPHNGCRPRKRNGCAGCCAKSAPRGAQKLTGSWSGRRHLWACYRGLDPPSSALSFFRGDLWHVIQDPSASFAAAKAQSSTSRETAATARSAHGKAPLPARPARPAPQPQDERLRYPLREKQKLRRFLRYERKAV